MKSMMMGVLVSTLTIGSVCADPIYYITHNNTDVETNLFLDGYIPSPSPTAAKTTRKILWRNVKLGCEGHTRRNKCSALVRMASNKSNSVDLGTVTLDLVTGVVTPQSISANGYTLTVNGVAEVTINQD